MISDASFLPFCCFDPGLDELLVSENRQSEGLTQFEQFT